MVRRLVIPLFRVATCYLPVGVLDSSMHISIYQASTIFQRDILTILGNSQIAIKEMDIKRLVD